MKIGNVMHVYAQPHLVVAPGVVLNPLRDAALIDETTRITIISTHGNVILVILKRKGNNCINTFRI